MTGALSRVSYFASADLSGQDSYDLLAADLIHPTDVGHATIASLIARVFASN